MLISTQKMFIFVANTKAASTSIEAVLMPFADIRHGGDPRRKHVSLHETQRLYPKVFAQPGQAPDDFFRFGVMREPLDWIGSWFRYRKGNKVESPLPAEMDFAAFWAKADWNIRRGDGSRYLQRDMFCAPDGRVLADMIIPYHDLDAVFARICTALGMTGPLPRHNVSRVKTHTIPETLETELRDYYAEDYALFSQLDQINAAGLARLQARAAS